MPSRAALLQDACTSFVQPPQLVEGIQIDHREVIVLGDRLGLCDLGRNRHASLRENQSSHDGLNDRYRTQPPHGENIHGGVNHLSWGPTEDLGID